MHDKLWITIALIVFVAIAYCTVDGLRFRFRRRSRSSSRSSQEYKPERNTYDDDDYYNSGDEEEDGDAVEDDDNRRYRGPKYDRSMWNTPRASETLYGVSSYMRRTLYKRNPEREPKVCFNKEDLRNETYGYFICPEPYQQDDYDQCCVETGGEKCCTSEEYGRQTYILIVVAIGLVVVAIIFGVVAIIYRRQLKKCISAVL